MLLPVTTPTAEVSVARSYSCAAQTSTAQEKIEMEDLPTPRGITIPLGRSGASPHDPPPMNELENKSAVDTFIEVDFNEGIEEALSALVSASPFLLKLFLFKYFDYSLAYATSDCFFRSHTD